MAGSTLDPDNLPPQRGRKTLKGHDVGSLGPSDTSDSGPEPDVRANSDRGFDRVVGTDEAGLGAAKRSGSVPEPRKRKP